MSEQVYIYSDDPQREEAFKFLKLLSDSIFESRHTPIVLDVYGEAVDLIIKRDATLKAQRDELLEAAKSALSSCKALYSSSAGRHNVDVAILTLTAAITKLERVNNEQ